MYDYKTRRIYESIGGQIWRRLSIVKIGMDYERLAQDWNGQGRCIVDFEVF